jgi:hypothetical protein
MATPTGRGTQARVQCGTPTGTAIKGRRQRQREEELKQEYSAVRQQVRQLKEDGNANEKRNSSDQRVQQFKHDSNANRNSNSKREDSANGTAIQA